MKRFAGFDIGGTHARVSLYDENWRVVAQQRQRIRGNTAPQAVAEAMVNLLNEVWAHDNSGTESLAAIGFGLAGQMSRDGQTVVNAPNLGWQNIPFVRVLKDALQSRFQHANVAMINDLSALLWGEFSAGAVQDVNDVLAVYVGTGIGGAILSHGQLMRGAGAKAGEIGHVKVVVGGRLCGCGERGCVEAYAGGIHLERQVAQIAHAHSLDEVFVDDARTRVNLAGADALTRTSTDLEELWDTSTDYLAIAIANACTLLNPGVLLLGGGVLAHCDHFRGLLLSKITPLILAAARDDLEVRFPTLGDDAGVLGAAKLAASTLER